MGNDLRNTERKAIVTETVSSFLRDGDRMSWAKARHRTAQWCIQEWRMPLAFNLIRKHPRLFDTDVVQSIEKRILIEFETMEVGQVPELKTRLTSSTPVPFGADTGRMPHVARRADLRVPDETQRAMRIVSDLPLRLDHGLYTQFIKPWLDTLPINEAQKLVPPGIKDEIELIDKDGFYTTLDRCDEQTRMYPDWFHLSIKVLRYLFLFSEEYPVNMGRYTSDLIEQFGEDFPKHAEAFAADPVAFAKARGDDYSEVLEECCAMWHWLHAKSTGTTAALWEMDAIGSGPSHIAAEAAKHDPGLLVDLDRTSNARCENFTDPKTLLGQHMRLVQPVLFRDASSKAMRKLAGSIASPGTYGGGAIAFTGSFLGLAYDAELGEFKLTNKDGEPIKFEVPQLLQPWVEGVQCRETQVKRILKLSKHFVTAFNRAFPWIAPANEAARNEWEHGYQSTGWPGAIVDDAYTNQPGPIRAVPTRWRRVKAAVRPILHYPDGTKRKAASPTYLSATVFATGSSQNGSPALAKRIHRKDAELCARVIIILHEMGVPCLTVHDAFFVPWMFRELVNRIYVEEFGKMHDINLIAPDAMMLKH